MNVVFYISAAIAVVSTLMVVTRTNAVHALLYLVVSLLAVAMVFYTFGAPLMAALEVIIYAGAIMVLFVFVVMMLNLGPRAAEQEARWLTPGMWVGPAVLGALLLAEWIWAIAAPALPWQNARVVEPKPVGVALYGPYLLGVDLASFLLLSGLVGAYHLGRRELAMERPPKRVIPKTEEAPYGPPSQILTEEPVGVAPDGNGSRREITPAATQQGDPGHGQRSS